MSLGLYAHLVWNLALFKCTQSWCPVTKKGWISCQSTLQFLYQSNVYFLHHTWHDLTGGWKTLTSVPWWCESVQFELMRNVWFGHVFFLLYTSSVGSNSTTSTTRRLVLFVSQPGAELHSAASVPLHCARWAHYKGGLDSQVALNSTWGVHGCTGGATSGGFHI